MLTFVVKEKLLARVLLILVAFSAGALMGGAILHLLPQAIEKFASYNVFAYLIIGFVLFFLVEKLLYWRHCHVAKCPVHTFAYMNLIGDAVHNFIDGLIIATSFVTNFHLGIATTLAVALHEIPQEIGDFGVLIYGGFKKNKALILNYLCAVCVVIGGVVGYFLPTYVELSVMFLLPFAAGGFIYIAASDLIPEIKKEEKLRKSLQTFLIFVLGILLMYCIKFVE
jgi:zinc and cadmium transporter